MMDEQKKIMFEKTAALEQQVKEVRGYLSEFDPVRSEIERRYHHNLDVLIMQGLLNEYSEYAKTKREE